MNTYQPKPRIFTTMLAMLATFAMFAQTVPPQGITYQAVALDADGQEIIGVDASGLPIASKQIKVRFKIIKDNPNGIIEYSEEHTTNTDQYGLFTLIIGEGNKVSSTSFAEIDWAEGAKFLEVDLDINNSGSYRLSSVQQMFSVPYALYAAKADTAAYAASSPGGSAQTLALTNDSLAISGGNTVDLSPYLDNTDEQTLTLSNDSLTISNGNTVDLTPYLDIPQTLSISSDTLSISGGNSVLVPSNTKDTSSTNELQDLFIQGDSLKITKSGSSVFFQNNGNSLSNPSKAYVQDACYYTTGNSVSTNGQTIGTPNYEDSSTAVFVKRDYTNTTVNISYYFYSKLSSSFVDTVNFNFNNLTFNTHWNVGFQVYRQGVFAFKIGNNVIGYDAALTLLYGNATNISPLNQSNNYEGWVYGETQVYGYNPSLNPTLIRYRISDGNVLGLSSGTNYITPSFGDNVLIKGGGNINAKTWDGVGSIIQLNQFYVRLYKVDNYYLGITLTQPVASPPMPQEYKAQAHIYVLDSNFANDTEIANFWLKGANAGYIAMHNHDSTSALHFITQNSQIIGNEMVGLPSDYLTFYELVVDFNRLTQDFSISEIRPIPYHNIFYYELPNTIVTRIAKGTFDKPCVNGNTIVVSQYIFEFFGD